MMWLAAVAGGWPMAAEAQWVTERLGRDGAAPLPVEWVVADATSGTCLHTTIRVEGLHPRKPLDVFVPCRKRLELPPERQFTRAVVHPGYLPLVERVWSDGAAGGTDTLCLLPAQPGVEQEIEAIEFLPDGAELPYASLLALQSLVEFLDLHPDVRLAVIGNVNDPDHLLEEAECLRLSRDRARAVWEFLLLSGIDPRRIEVQGRGRENMRFPRPTTPEEVDANRRITIRVLES